MRRPAADYLEAYKIEELADDLSREGYQVEREASVGNQQFDLVARRNGELVVYEVKARSRLKESVEQLARLRAAAREAGVTSYRLVVVNPPRETEVAVEGLEAALLAYFVEELPTEVDQLSYETHAKRVKLFEIDSIDVRPQSVRVRGRAALDVELNYRGKTERIDVTVDEGLEFTFDVELGSDLKLARVNIIKVDVSDFADEGE
jgi:Holliday junction resolvase